MLDFSPFYAALAQNQLSTWLETLPAQLANWRKEALHGDFASWQKVLQHLPVTKPSIVELQQEVKFGTAADISTGEAERIRYLLQQLKPWRKRPLLYSWYRDRYRVALGLEMAARITAYQ